jgi:hypothetical protein
MSPREKFYDIEAKDVDSEEASARMYIAAV